MTLRDEDVERLRTSARLVGNTFGERFEIVGQAGSGGMGRVFEAIDREVGTRVAIKVIAGTSDHARFAAEAEVLERLDHPAIVRHVRHGVTTRGEPYLAMEWLVGESLARRLESKPLSVLEAAILGERIADALDHVHRAGVVHRDVKPSNIFLVERRAELAHLIDFGVAKLADRDVTRTGQLIGTPGYMAPEQVRGEKTVDRRVDLFALGCVLYESLAGRPPFRGAEVMELLARLLLEAPVELASLVPDVPPRMAHLVGALLAKDPKRRLGDASLARRELAAIGAALAVGDRSALALRPDTVPNPDPATAATIDDRPRLGKRRRRQRLMIAAGVGAVIAIVLAQRGWFRSPELLPCDDNVRTGCEARCNDDDAGACSLLAQTLASGYGGAPIDRAASAAAYSRSCELGSGPACVSGAAALFLDVDHGLRPRREGLAKAERMLTIGCDHGDAHSCDHLGRQHYPGKLFAPDASRALILVARACDGDLVNACVALKQWIKDDAGDLVAREQARRSVAAACERKLRKSLCDAN